MSEMAEPEFDTIRYERPVAGVARVVLDRPAVHNAQSIAMTYELNDAFHRAAHDDEVKVIILAASGEHFCSGHDLGEPRDLSGHEPVGNWGGFERPGAEGWMASEEEIYLSMCRRWRNIPKPVIAAVQGKVITGALMLVWVCDLVVASEDATFRDTAVSLGGNGVEWFGHPWELGARRAKEFLFTGDEMTAHQAREAGMVNRVVPRDRLEEAALELAQHIATRPSFALKLAKESVNQTLDAQGQWTSLQAAFALHQLAHSHNQQVFGVPIDPSGIPRSLRRRATRAGKEQRS